MQPEYLHAWRMLARAKQAMGKQLSACQLQILDAVMLHSSIDRKGRLVSDLNRAGIGRELTGYSKEGVSKAYYELFEIGALLNDGDPRTGRCRLNTDWESWAEIDSETVAQEQKANSSSPFSETNTGAEAKKANSSSPFSDLHPGSEAKKANSSSPFSDLRRPSLDQDKNTPPPPNPVAKLNGAQARRMEEEDFSDREARTETRITGEQPTAWLLKAATAELALAGVPPRDAARGAKTLAARQRQTLRRLDPEAYGDAVAGVCEAVRDARENRTRGVQDVAAALVVSWLGAAGLKPSLHFQPAEAGRQLAAWIGAGWPTDPDLPEPDEASASAWLQRRQQAAQERQNAAIIDGQSALQRAAQDAAEAARRERRERLAKIQAAKTSPKPESRKPDPARPAAQESDAARLARLRQRMPAAGPRRDAG